MITEALEKVITAINQADVSEQEKNEAKSLLRKLLLSEAATSVLGPGAQSLAVKYLSAFRRRAQQNAFRRRDARQQSRLFALCD
jgi:hypothetical protein